jgi:hypothetical protein
MILVAFNQTNFLNMGVAYDAIYNNIHDKSSHRWCLYLVCQNGSENPSENHQPLPARWGPPVRSWFINPLTIVISPLSTQLLSKVLLILDIINQLCTPFNHHFSWYQLNQHFPMIFLDISSMVSVSPGARTPPHVWAWSVATWPYWAGDVWWLWRWRELCLWILRISLGKYHLVT